MFSSSRFNVFIRVYIYTKQKQNRTILRGVNHDLKTMFVLRRLPPCFSDKVSRCVDECLLDGRYTFRKRIQNGEHYKLCSSIIPQAEPYTKLFTPAKQKRLIRFTPSIQHFTLETIHKHTKSVTASRVAEENLED